MTPYILHVAIILSGCLAFYKLLLQRETFFRLNRMVLLICLVLSFALPLLPVPQQWSFRQAEVVTVLPAETTSASAEAANKPVEKSDVIQPAPSASNAETSATMAETSAPSSIDLSQFGKWLFYLYWFGVAAFALNFLLQLGTLINRAYSRPVIKDGEFRIVELSGDHAPCSFGNNIFINPEKYDWDTYNQILLHEKIHIQQGHSFDILIAEIVLIFQWFNPFAWLYRKELECNLEFLTDNELIDEKVVDKSSYQVSLLKVSAPHFPLSLTTNYNQSLLKKRLVMMNAKRSNINTTWKYFFLLPLSVLFVCFLNKPVVYSNTGEQVTANTKTNDRESRNYNGNMDTEGAWFATIKDDKVSVQFKNDDDDRNSYNSNTFPLSAFKDYTSANSFTITRDAGNIVLTGKFEGNQGMGRYKFTGDKNFASYLATEGVKDTDEKDLMVYFLVDVSKSYIQTLKSAGYSNFRKNDLIPLAAMKIDGPYIQSIKNSGFQNISLHDLIPFKAMKIDEAYISDIRKAGYTNVTTGQLISFKAQGIDGKYIADVRAASKSDSKLNPNQNSSAAANSNSNNNSNTDDAKPARNSKDAKGVKPARDNNESDADDDRDGNGNANDANYIISYKALNIDAEYVRSIREAGYPEISKSNIIAMKSMDINADYIKSVRSMGFPDVSASNVIAMKSQNITADYANSFKAVGLTDISASNLIAMKSMDVTPEFVKGFMDAGFKQLSPSKIISLKAQNITPAVIKEYQALGFSELSVNDVISAKATGTTPKFIASMKEKGHDLKSIGKYVQLKVAID